MRLWDYFVEEGDIIIEEFNDQDPGYQFILRDYMDNLENGFWDMNAAIEMLLGFRQILALGLLGDFYGIYALRIVFPDVWREAVRRQHVLAIPWNQ